MAHITNLPAEISNLTVDLVVVEYYDIIVKSMPSIPDSGSRALSCTPALASTCKTLRRQTLPIYYGQNTWRIEYAEDGTAWINRLRSLFPEYIVRKVPLGRRQASGPAAR